MIRDRVIEDTRIQCRIQGPDSVTYESAYKLTIAMETASKDVLDLQKRAATTNVTNARYSIYLLNVVFVGKKCSGLLMITNDYQQLKTFTNV